MASSITITRVVRDARPNSGVAGLVIGEHVFDDGETWPAQFEARAGEDALTRLQAMIVDRQSQRIENEVRRNIHDVMTRGSEAVVKIVASTVAQNAAALRVAYESASRFEAIMMGDYLSTLTNAQLQSAFGMTAGQVTTLRANKLTPAANAAATIRAAVGA